MGVARAAAIASAALAAGACARPEVVSLPLPALGAADSALLVATPAEGAARAWALDLRSGAPPLVEAPLIGDDDALVVDVASFAVALPALGLTAGALELGALTAGRSLAAPVAAFTSPPSDGARTWTPLAALPPSLGAVRLPRATGPCAPLKLSAVALPVAADPSAMVDLGGEAVLVAMSDGALIRATRDAAELLAVRTASVVRAAFRARDGELWLLGAGGAVLHGTLEVGLAPAPSAPREVALVAVVQVPGSTRAVDVFVSSEVGDLYRFDGARWTTLHVGDDAPSNSRSLAAIAPDHVVATANSNVVRRYRAGRVTEEQPYTEGVREIEAVTYVPGVGVIAGAAIEGRCIVDRGDARWALLPAVEGGPAGVGSGANRIAPYRGGFWAAGSAGAHMQWYEGWGFCSVGQPLGVRSLSGAVVRGAAIVAVTSFDVGIRPAVVWLDP